MYSEKVDSVLSDNYELETNKNQICNPSSVLENTIRIPYPRKPSLEIAEPSSSFLFLQSKLYKELKQLSILSFFAIIGLLARKGLIVLTNYDGSYLSGVVWANFTACVIIGFSIGSTSSWASFIEEKEGRRGRTIFFIGITTGFCGTFSSFSSLLLEAFEKSANISPDNYYSYPNPAYGIMNGLAVFITQLCLSAAGIKFGKHLVKGYDPNIGHIELIETIIAILGILCWITVIALISIESWRSWIFACIVSPIACFMRYYCGKWLNPKIKKFPLGTFFVNILATTILGALTITQRGKAPWMTNSRIVNSKLTCQMIDGLQDGFCGTLSTVATMFVEMSLMKEPKNYIYGGITFLLAYCILVILLGSYNWTHGLLEKGVC